MAYHYNGNGLKIDPCTFKVISHRWPVRTVEYCHARAQAAKVEAPEKERMIPEDQVPKATSSVVKSSTKLQD